MISDSTNGGLLMSQTRKREQKRKIIERYWQSGWSLKRLAKQLGVSVSSAQGMAYRMGFIWSERPLSTPERKAQAKRNERIRKEFPVCISMESLAKELCIDIETLKKIAKRLGVSRKYIDPFLGNENELYLEATTPEPTDCPSGSQAKLDVMAERVRNRQELFHEEDRVDYE